MALIVITNNMIILSEKICILFNSKYKVYDTPPIIPETIIGLKNISLNKFFILQTEFNLKNAIIQTIKFEITVLITAPFSNIPSIGIKITLKINLQSTPIHSTAIGNFT